MRWNIQDIKAIIFDFDNTLYSLNTNWRTYKTFIGEIEKKYNLNLRRSDYKNYASYVHQLLGFIDTNILKDLEKIELENDLLKPKIDEGIVQLILKLSNNGKLLFILSHNLTNSINHILTYNNLKECFSKIVGLETCEKTKPNPLEIEKIISKNHLNKHQVLYIGDKVFDKLTAANAGIMFLKVDKPKELLNHFLENA